MSTAQARIAARAKQARKDAEEAARRRPREVIEERNRAYVASQVQTRTRKGVQEGRCPGCNKWVTMQVLDWDHGWSLERGKFPLQVGCMDQLRQSQRDFPVFAATQDCVGCGPLDEPWTTAKRFYVMEHFLYCRDRLLPWAHKWGPTRLRREVPWEPQP